MGAIVAFFQLLPLVVAVVVFCYQTVDLVVQVVALVVAPTLAQARAALVLLSKEIMVAALLYRELNQVVAVVLEPWEVTRLQMFPVAAVSVCSRQLLARQLFTRVAAVVVSGSREQKPLVRAEMAGEATALT
jgi:hypothetical protein